MASMPSRILVRHCRRTLTILVALIRCYYFLIPSHLGIFGSAILAAPSGSKSAFRSTKNGSWSSAVDLLGHGSQKPMSQPPAAEPAEPRKVIVMARTSLEDTDLVSQELPE